ncbi:hypothetical protein [Scytonema sp. NUACC26]
MSDRILQILLSQWQALTKLRFQRHDRSQRLLSIHSMPILGAFIAATT